MKKKIGLILGATAALSVALGLYSSQKKLTKPEETEKPTADDLNEGDSKNWTHDYIMANGINFHYVTQGSGPLLILLHGFPENWYSWKYQIPFLAEKFKVVSIDMRGYNLSDKPPSVKDYQLTKLTEDIKALIYAFDEEKAVIVGHDWGGVVAWAFAMKEPEMLEKLVIMNSPHPVGLFKALKTSTQLLHSWYIGFFQLPVIPELMFGVKDFKFMADYVEKTYEKPEIGFNEADKKEFLDSIRKPGAITTMLNYYRAVMRYGSGIKTRKIETPTLLLWGEKDKFLLKKVNDGIEKGVPNITIKYFPEATHWVHREEPDAVNRELAEFLF